MKGATHYLGDKIELKFRGKAFRKPFTNFRRSKQLYVVL